MACDESYYRQYLDGDDGGLDALMKKYSEIWPKRPVRIVVWVEGGIRGYGRGQESGKQCKAVPTLRKQADSVHTGPACFMLVGALPQSPQNTKTVFWNDG